MRRERGAVSLEYGGSIAVAALVVALVGGVVASPTVGQAVSAVVCKVFTIGQGECAMPQFESEKDRTPTQPCTTNNNGYSVNGEMAFLNGVGSTTRGVHTEKLSNGQYRVTVSDLRDAGVKTGAGWDARVEINGTRWGDDMSVSADGRVRAVEQRTYVVDSKGAAERIARSASFNEVVDGAAESAPGPLGFVAKHVGAPVTKWVGERAGFESLPEPTSTTYLGGASVEASAVITPFVGGAEAKLAGSAVVGVRTNADGTTTVLAEGKATATLSGAISIKSGSIGPDARVIVAATYKGSTLLSADVTTESLGNGTRDVETWSLPVATDADRTAAQNVLYNPLPTAWDDFFDRANSTGDHTRVSYDTSKNTTVQASGDIWFVEGLGAKAGFALPNESVATAEYFNGTDWATWDACKA